MDPKKKEREAMTRFLKALEKVRVSLDADISKERKLVYWDRLQRYPIDVLERALDLACDQSLWFPKIVELHDLIKQVGSEEIESKIGPERQIPEMRANPETARIAVRSIMEKLKRKDKDGMIKPPESWPRK